jgi:LysR family transcriptional regulator, regulator for bpeEF and oprC
MAGLQAYIAFAETVKRGGFAGAARELGLSPSAVAKSITRLEAELGVRLFHRTTRTVALTSEGHELAERCRRIVEEVEALRDEAAGTRAEPSGMLRLNVPITFGKRVIVPKLAELVLRFPAITLEVAFSDRYADVVGEGLDAAVRIGPLVDSSLIARPFAQQTLITCAAPAYLHRRGIPSTPAAINSHACVMFRLPTSGRLRPWVYSRAGRTYELAPKPVAVFNDGEALVAAAASGLGLVQVPDYMATEALAGGSLREVLKHWRSPPAPILLVYPSARRVMPRLRALLELLAGPEPRRRR